MIGTSARPFSVSAYSTRGGTSGNVWRATTPSSSSARRRSERVRGEMPCQRALELAEARAAVGEIADHEQRPLAADDVGGAADGTIGVRHEGAVYRNTSRTEVAIRARRRRRAPRSRAARRARSSRPAASSASNRSSTEPRARPPRSHDQVAALEPGTLGRAPVRPPRARAGRRAPGARRRCASGARGGAARARRPSRGRSVASPRRERVDARAHRRVGGHGEDQPALAADGVEARAAVRPGRRAGRPRSRAAAARCARSSRRRGARRAAEAAAGRGDQPERRAQPAAARVGEREHGEPRRSSPTAAGSQATAGASPVSTSTTARSRSGSAPVTRPCSVRPSPNVTATSSPRSTCAQVSTRPGAITTPDPRPQPRPRPTTAGPTRSAAPATACCSLEYRSRLCLIAESLATCKSLRRAGVRPP